MLLVPALWLLSLCVVLVRQAPDRTDALPGVTKDAPYRLLMWAVGLLPDDRAEWGHAMVGEMSYLEGRSERWRFAAGCALSMLRPPWGRIAVPSIVLIVVAGGAAFIEIALTEHYGWVAGSQEASLVVVAILAAFCCAGIALLRRPGVAIPGVIGGLVVAAAWLSTLGFTFSDLVEGKTVSFGRLIAMLLVPVVVGLATSWWTGHADVGKRAARLAAVTAGLVTYLYGCIAVMAIGSGGGPGDSGSSLAATVSDRLNSQGIEFLLLLPTLTAVLGWAASALPARLGIGTVGRPSAERITRLQAGQPARRSLVGCAAVAGAIGLVALTFLTK